MITFLATLLSSPKVRTASIYVLLVIGAMWGLRQYTNKAYSDGRSEGVKAALSESISASEISWRSELEQAQKQINAATAVSLKAAQAAVDAGKNADAVRQAAASVIASIPAHVASVPSVALPEKLVENDSALTNRTDNTEALQRALLASQLTNKELFDEVNKLQDNWREYQKATENQIDGLHDELAATQGQLRVMTQERDVYKASFESATKKRGCGTFKKIITLGVCR